MIWFLRVPFCLGFSGGPSPGTRRAIARFMRFFIDFQCAFLVDTAFFFHLFQLGVGCGIRFGFGIRFGCGIRTSIGTRRGGGSRHGGARLGSTVGTSGWRDGGAHGGGGLGGGTGTDGALHPSDIAQESI